MKFDLDFNTSHRQFYIVDKETWHDNDPADFWTEKAFRERLVVGKGLLAVGTECYGPVKSEFSLLDTENKTFDFNSFDHIVEASIDLPSGILQVFPCIGQIPVKEISIEKGTYIVRVYSSRLRTVYCDEGDDFYCVEIWPGEKTTSKVLKQFIT